MLIIKKCRGCGLHFQMYRSAQRCERCRERHKKAQRETPEATKKAAARALTKHGLAAGTITPAPCEICGNPKSEAHHVDYDRPLDVKWLCRQHHMAIHQKMRLQRVYP
jgi:hypothetical protein